MAGPSGTNMAVATTTPGFSSSMMALDQGGVTLSTPAGATILYTCILLIVCSLTLCVHLC